MKTVAVIGAGCSGLTTIKSCLEEGLNPTCFEMTSSVGGLWNYTDDQCPERATVFRGVIMNTSKEMSSFSDFVAPTQFGTFLPHDQYAKYCQLYAQNYDLIKRIKFNHKVIKVKQDETAKGRWVVVVEDLKGGVTFENSFDFVMVCNGHHCKPNWPSIPGQEDFQGVQIHSQQYRKPEAFENKRVLVVGFGNSACDIAAECSTIAKTVYISSRHKYWIIPRQLRYGTPWDTKLLTRWNGITNLFRGQSAVSDVFENEAQQRFDHYFYGVSPQDRFVNHYPVANDVISLQILAGKVILKDGLKHITEDGAHFENDKESEVEPIKFDVIIYATGFQPRAEFLNDVMDLDNEITKIYKMIFPLKLTSDEHAPTMAFVGLVDTNGYSNAAVYELQARYAALVFNGAITLPKRSIMEKQTDKHIRNLKALMGENTRLMTVVDSVPYSEDLAGEIGCKPNLLHLMLTDWQLFWAVLTGPLLPFQNRLRGPHSWTGARDAILGFRSRFGLHMQTRPDTKMKFNKMNASKKNYIFLDKTIIVNTIVLAGYCVVFRFLIKRMRFSSLRP